MILKRNVLIFHLGALGDFIVTWPLALTFARLYPQSRIFYVTHGQKGALAEKVLRLESIDIESGWHRLFSEDPELPAPSASALAATHTVVSFLADEKGQWAKNVAWANPDAKLISLTTHAPAEFAGHVSEFLIQQLAALPAAQTAAPQILRSINERGLSSARNISGPVLVHPGSGAERKNWPAEKFLELVQHLRDSGRPVKVALGEVELEHWPPALVRQFEAVAVVVRPGSLLELFAEMTSASAFVGNDSGPAHLAGILGLPTVAIFGSTSSPARWKPLGPNVRPIAASLDTLEVAQVRDALL